MIFSEHFIKIVSLKSLIVLTFKFLETNLT